MPRRAAALALPIRYRGLELNYSVTFPGKVTEADGGKVEGNKVTFTDSMNHKVKGKDGSIPIWVWILVGVGALAVVGGAAAFFIIRSKKNKSQPSYGAPVQGYDPNQAFPGQPGQQAGYGALRPTRPAGGLRCSSGTARPASRLRHPSGTARPAPYGGPQPRTGHLLTPDSH